MTEKWTVLIFQVVTGFSRFGSLDCFAQAGITPLMATKLGEIELECEFRMARRGSFLSYDVAARVDRHSV